MSYNANGGAGVPSNQTKTHGTDLVLSSTIPTRKYYTFKGWATSSTATTATYSAGGVYKNNSNVTLYAVWEVAYIIPRITGVSITRCDSEGDPQDDGTYALIKFNWATDEDVSAIKIYWKASTDTAYGNNIQVAATGRGGSVSEVVGGGSLSEDSAYNFKINVADSTDFNSVTQTLSATLFPIDLLKGGKGVTIGAPAKQEGFNVEMVSRFNKDVYFNGKKYGANNLLWSGAYFANDQQTISLNGKITEQPHGIILAWSLYYEGPADSNWNYVFIPKRHVAQHSGQSVTMILTYTGGLGVKTVYITDESIIGHASNDDGSFEFNGFNVGNSKFVLREVIGV